MDKYIKITYQGQWCIYSVEDGLEEIKTFVNEGESGDEFNVFLIEMTKEDFEFLPEFTGW